MTWTKSFLLGIFAAIAALVFQQLALIFWEMSFGNTYDVSWSQNLALSMSMFLPVAVLIEEIMKYIVISRQIDIYSYGRSVILHSMLMGLSFALTEVILIASNVGIANLLQPEILGIFLVHITTAGLIGYGVAVHPRHTLGRIFVILFGATLIHSLYNIGILLQDTIPYYIPLALVGLFTFFLLITLFTVNKKLAQE